MAEYLGNAYVSHNGVAAPTDCAIAGYGSDNCGGYKCAADGCTEVGCVAAGCIAAGCGVNACGAAGCGVDFYFGNVCFSCGLDLMPWSDQNDSSEI